jgi:hypothetical protein
MATAETDTVSTLILASVWRECQRLQKEALDLITFGTALASSMNYHTAGGLYAHAKGREQVAEGERLKAEATMKWAAAVMVAFGNVEMTWIGQEPGKQTCVLPNGEHYGEHYEWRETPPR